jgi:hypothetical protein
MTDVTKKSGTRSTFRQQTDAGLFEVNTDSDGSHCMVVDGQVIGAFRWRPDQLDDCIRMAQRLAKAAESSARDDRPAAAGPCGR